MGTLGCAPAYDRFFVEGIKSLGVSTGNFNLKSLDKLINFYRKNSDRLEEIRKSLHVDKSNLIYPQMKLIDMGFWQIGYVLDLWKINHKEEKLPELPLDFVKELLNNS